MGSDEGVAEAVGGERRHHDREGGADREADEAHPLRRLAHVYETVPSRDVWRAGIPTRCRGPCHHRSVPVAPPSPLRVRRRRVPERWRLDTTTLAAVVVSVLFSLALLAVFTLSSTMLTRIGVGVLIALALDPLVGSLERRLPGQRGTAVAVVGLAVLGVAALLVLVLGPQAVEQARQFSQQLPDTIDQLEQLPLVGGGLHDEDIRGEGTGGNDPGAAPAIHRRTDRRGRRDRLASGVAGVARS